VRDVVERTIVDPTPADLVRIRREAIDAAIRAGAAPDRVEVVVEVDRQRNRVRASASGATALVEGANAVTAASETERLEAGLRALRADASSARGTVRTASFLVVEAKGSLAIVDERAVVRLIAPRGNVALSEAAHLPRAIAATIEEFTAYGDVGRALPDLWLLVGARIVELTGLNDAESALALAADDVSGTPDDVMIAIVAVVKPA
jgi:N-methylhydantoinase A